jgi:hypothetical protein
MELTQNFSLEGPYQEISSGTTLSTASSSSSSSSS